ncbi:hypothetical protein QTP88_027249 [Uroleucon formosanum]
MPRHSSTGVGDATCRLLPCPPKYPINSNIDPSKQKSFNPIWLKEYPMLEYSLITDSAYCFVCSLFPKVLGRQLSNESWIKQGVNKWQKMKS